MDAPRLKRILGLSDLVFLNVVAIFSVRGMTTAAKMGPIAPMLWGIAVLTFFIPLGLTVTELTTRDPREGGFYRWTRQGFGEATGFLCAWFYWVCNITYLPGLLIFFTSVAAFAVGRPSLGDDPVFAVVVSQLVLWTTTWLNVRGVEAGRRATGAGALTNGLAAIILIGLGVVALMRFGSATTFSASAAGTGVGGLLALGYFGTLAFSLCGFELAPLMGGEIRDPVRAVPKAILVSGVVVGALYIAGTLAILCALRPDDISPISGALGAAQTMADRAGWHAIGLLVAVLVGVSVVGGFSTWLGGVARLPLAVGLDRFLPAWLARVHPKHGSPHLAILLQAVLTSALILISQAGSSVREAYLVLLDMTIVMNFVPFLFLFLSLPKLRPARDEPGVVRVPGGRGVLWTVAFAGFVTTLLSMAASLIPPPDVEHPALFLLKLVGGLVLFGLAGYLIFARYRGARD